MLLLLSHKCHLFSKADQSLVQLCTATFVRPAVLPASGTCQLEIECNYISTQQLLCSLLIWSAKEEFLRGLVKPNWVSIKELTGREKGISNSRETEMCRLVSHLAQADLFVAPSHCTHFPTCQGAVAPLCSAASPGVCGVSTGSAQLLLDRFPCVNCLRRYPFRKMADGGNTCCCALALGSFGFFCCCCL